MSHALLLRLFLSPSFFSVHVALQYLTLYSDNIGITYYLTRRLRELDIEELRDVWGFICHLLITRPSQSRALECFVVDTAQKSTHIAMLTLWFLQASLQDLSSPNRQNVRSFTVCQSTLHKCHEIIFGDLPIQAQAPYSGLNLPFDSLLARRKVRPILPPALIGLGLALAAPGLPQLVEVMGEVAIEQGRADEEGNDMRSLEPGDRDVVIASPARQTVNLGDDEDEDVEAVDEDRVISIHPEAHSSKISRLNEMFDCHVEGSSNQGSLSRRKTIGAARTSPALPLHLGKPRRPRFSDDPLGQYDPPSPVHATTPFQSSPSLSTSKPLLNLSHVAAADILLQNYDSKAQTHLLRSHYCRSEVQFLLSLEDISNRLLVVPKPARVSALRAELTTLNHKLPAEVCMPMWCSSSDTPRQVQGLTQPHHRIVRIPPGESVVLNSAERAPYLLLIEILNGDLDFDPGKRGNKEVLKKIVVKEQEKKGASQDLVFFRSHTSPRHSANPEVGNGFDAVLSKNTEASEAASEAATSRIAAASTDNLDQEDEEMDLVEQLYGSELPLRSQPADLSETIVLPPAPKNKDLDMAAWSRSSSIPPSPAIEQGSELFNSPVTSASGHFRPALPLSHSTSRNQDSISGANGSPRILSLDEYSERMRTAAVMLAQLNANLVREPVGGPSAPGTPVLQATDTMQTSKPLSWLPGSSWVSLSAPPSNVVTSQGPVHPSLGGRPSQVWGNPTQASSSALRMKLNPQEASAIRDRIMKEMIALEEERMDRMRENREGDGMMRIGDTGGDMKTAEDESIIRRELNKADPSAVVFSESWATKKSRIRQGSPYGHLANWDCVSVIVKTGGDLRQEQLAVQLIREFQQIWLEERCQCWVRYFRILVTGGNSGLVETITDAVSIHSIKKAEYARRLTLGRLGYVTLLDHFRATYGSSSSAKFVRAQKNFAKSLAGYSLVTYFLQIKDRHNGNILLDREGHLVHIDFGFMLSNSPGNIGFEAAPFKLPLEYVEVLGGVDSDAYREFKRLFREGFEAARKHCDRIITLVELMQKDSSFPCFVALGDQTAIQLRERFQPTLTHSLVDDHIDRLIETSLGSNWTRLYDSYQYYSQSIL
ncbi:hypothetical protein JAAARDRAFT_31790 [Jaapia argillacea MUCL 33604]|uniref:1-phosphatidylinositol 4-kinase n=1 Tax=Jaapia argillacea MUCL 33604 TaxID=933084 RepID=A0A067QBB4_9AGAM|nr:hypothetical protein JAAARDRAFT_31790 [Jaapia argillacea MUCL 33604]